MVTMMARKLRNSISSCFSSFLFILSVFVFYFLQDLAAMIIQNRWNASARASESCDYSDEYKFIGGKKYYVACRQQMKIENLQIGVGDKFGIVGKGEIKGKQVAVVSEQDADVQIHSVGINGEGIQSSSVSSLALYAVKERGNIWGRNVNIFNVQDGIRADKGGTITLSGGQLNATRTAVHAGKESRVILNGFSEIRGRKVVVASDGAIVTLNGNKNGNKLIATDTAVHAEKSSKVILNGFSEIRGVNGILAEGASVEVSDSIFHGTGTAFKVNNNKEEKGILRLKNVIIGQKTLLNQQVLTVLPQNNPEYGIVIQNDSSARVEGGEIVARSVALEIKNGGDAHLSRTKITAKTGIFVRGESKVTMNSGSVTSNNEDTILLSGQGSVNLSGVELKNIANKQVVRVKAGGSFYMEGGSIASKGGRAVQLEDGEITLHGVGVTSEQSAGLWVEQGRIVMTNGAVNAFKTAVRVQKKTGGNKDVSVLLNEVTVKSEGGGSEQGLYAKYGMIDMKGGEVEGRSVAVEASSDGQIRLSKGVHVKSTEAKGLVVNGDKATIEMAGGSITAKKVAVQALNGAIKLSSDVTVNSGEVNGRESRESYGLMAEGNGATIEMVGGVITAKSVKKSALVLARNLHEAGAQGKKSEEVVKASNVVAVKASDNGYISLLGDVEVKDTAEGLVANKSASIEMMNGSITVGKTAVKASNEGSIKLLGDLEVISQESDGLWAEEGATIEMTKGLITAKGVAVRASDRGSVKLLSDVIVRSRRSDGLVAEKGATIEMIKGSVTARYTAVNASDKGSIELLGDLEVISQKSDGLWAEGEEATIKMTGGSIDAQNTAVRASDRGSIELLSDVKVISKGLDGLWAEGEGATIKMTGGSIDAQKTAVNADMGSIELLGDVKVISRGSDGLFADGEGATIKMTKGLITAKEVAVIASHKGNIKLDGVGDSIKVWSQGNIGSLASEEAKITLKNVKIAVLGEGDGSAVMKSENSGIIEADGVKIVAHLTESVETTVENVGRRVGVHAKDKGVVRLNNTTLEGVHTGLRADGKEANIEMTDGKITAITGIINEGGAVTLKNTEVVTIGDSAGFIMGKGGKAEMFGGSLNFSNHGISLRDASFAAKGVSITGTGEKVMDMVFGAAFNANKTGLITLSDSKIDVTHHHGLYITNDSDFDRSDNNYGLNLPKSLGINVGRSELLVNGGASYGIYVMGSTLLPEHTKQVWLAESPIRERVALGTSFVSLQETTLKVPDSAAIYSDHGRAYIQLSQGTEISGSLLLETKEGKDEIIIVADNSSLIGGTRINDNSNVGFYLSNNSKWTLTKNQYEMLNGSDSKKPRDAGLPDSSISFIHLDRSSISFASQSVAPQKYQTLRIGKPGAARGDIAYYVSGGAHLYLNAYVDEKGQLDNQKTDRVLIEGSVAGRTTKVHVNGHLDVNDKKPVTKNDGKKKGISLIQVSGEAYKDSFELESGYITLGGLPYQYRLKAYGPNHSDTKKEKSVKRQRFVSGNGDNFWDFRLQEVMFGENGEELDWDEFGEDEDSLYGRHGRAFRAVAPQVPVYLVLPNAFFHTDLMDIDYQNKLLETMQVDAGDLSNKISIQGYDGSHRYTSNLTENEYGYGADVGYQGVQGSALLKTVENKHSNMFFGVMGNFGHLSLQPRQVAKGLKSTLDKWSLTAYGRVQHDNGFYANGTFSYGFLAGDVLTAERGVTVNLRGQPLSASLTTGKAFVTNYKGLVLEPQVQLIYQSVSFSEAVDVDGLNVQFDRPDQFTMRVGGRFGKTMATLQKGHFVSFYGRAHLTSSYGRDQFMYIHDAFRLGAFGSAIEGGFGVNAQLTSAVMVYGDLVYKHKLGTFGFTGTSVSGGLRYRF
ncbi:hypothetical protein H703_00988 [Bartonella bacilliformis Ver075]|nr:hypothetical protein H703_00988 [Bartonella bacilliformis Ver075]